LRDTELGRRYGKPNVGMFEGWQVGMLKGGSRGRAWDYRNAEGGVDKSRPMLALITLIVKYYYSTGILRVAIICSKDFARRRKQRGRAHCASWEGVCGRV
jgi:hypothetical protein